MDTEADGAAKAAEEEGGNEDGEVILSCEILYEILLGKINPFYFHNFLPTIP